MAGKVGVGLRAILTGDADILTEFGNPPRFYPGIARQNVAQPYAVYEMVSGEDVLELAQTSELARVTVQIDVFDDDFVDAYDGANLIRKVLKDYRGTIGGISIHDIYPDGGFRDDIGTTPDGRETKVHVVSQDFSVWHYRGDNP